MRNLICGLALAAALMTGCEGMAPGGYGDMPEDEDIAVAGAAIPQSPPPGGSNPPPYRPPTAAIPPPLSVPAATPTSSAPRSPSTPTAPTIPAPAPRPPAAPPLPPRPAVAACIAPDVFIRTQAAGGVEIKCGRPPMAPPASLSCMAPEQMTYLTRNGVSSFRCMR